MASSGESLSRATTHCLEKGGCCLWQCLWGDSCSFGSSSSIADEGREIVSSEAVGTVHISESVVGRVSEIENESVFSCVGNVCKFLKKNACVADKGEQPFTGLVQNPVRPPPFLVPLHELRHITPPSRHHPTVPTSHEH